MACSHPSPVAGCPDCAASGEGPTFVRQVDDGGSLDGSGPVTDYIRGPKPATPMARDKARGLLPRGTVVGRYVLVDRLGEGGMGRVYAAFDPELDRKVAIKLLRSTSGGAAEGVGEEPRVRLLREAQAMARLSHPNVVPIHDVGLYEQSVFLAMELVEGVTLQEWIREPRPWREVLQTFIAAGRGLAAAHAAGLVHRDFKPGNVLIGQDGRVRVTDFGIARAAGLTTSSDAIPITLPVFAQPGASPARPITGGTVPALDAALTQAGALMGTPTWQPVPH